MATATKTKPQTRFIHIRNLPPKAYEKLKAAGRPNRLSVHKQAQIVIERWAETAQEGA